jgi:hypothetical protein
MKPRYGPDETWPKHQKPYWSKVLGEAKTAGWTLKYDDAPHKFGDVFCPGGQDGASCSFMVDKTARGGEAKSREALIRNCRHGSVVQGSKVLLRHEECRRLLDHADRLIADAAKGLDAAESRLAALADLDRLQILLETAEANLIEILQDNLDEALQGVYATDEAPAPDEVSDALDEAAEAVDRGESVALKVRRPHLAKPLLTRVQTAQTRIFELRARLEELMP